MSAISDPSLHKEGQLVIRQVADLPEVLRLKRHIRRLELALPGLDAGERAVAEARLVARLGACGCTEGAVGLLAALPVAGGLAALELVGWPVWFFVLAVVCAGAALGKVFGLWRARQRLRTEIARISTELIRSP
jgi:hypothetical protein